MHTINDERLNDAEKGLLKAVNSLKFAGLLKTNILHQPDLDTAIKETFAELRKVEVDVCDHAADPE